MLASFEAVSSLEKRSEALTSVEALLHSHSTSVSAAAAVALQALWSAAIEPLSACLERCYCSSTQVVANAHFGSLVEIMLDRKADERTSAELRVPLLVLAMAKLGDGSAQVCLDPMSHDVPYPVADRARGWSLLQLPLPTTLGTLVRTTLALREWRSFEGANASLSAS